MSQVDRRSAAQRIDRELTPTQSVGDMPIPSSWIDRVIIRKLEARDLRAIEWGNEYRHLRQVYERAFQRSNNGVALLWVAEIPGWGVIGQVFLQLTSDRHELADGHTRAYLYSLRVKPEFRCSGIGSRLIDVVEETLIKRGVSMITLTVGKNNDRAISLYQRLGYVIVAHEPGLWSYQDENGKWRSVREPAWRMEKTLPTEF